MINASVAQAPVAEPSHLIRSRDEAEDLLRPGDYLECGCTARYDRADLDELNEDDLGLKCTGCDRRGAFVYHQIENRERHKRARMSERLPAPLASNFYPVPRALAEHADVLNLDGPTLLIIGALWSHAYDAGSFIYPSTERIAKLARCSTKTVGRKLAKLQKAGLIEIRTIGKAPNTVGKVYDLTPLWDRLAEIASAPGGTESPDPGTESPRLVSVPSPPGDSVEIECRQTTETAPVRDSLSLSGPILVDTESTNREVRPNINEITATPSPLSRRASTSRLGNDAINPLAPRPSETYEQRIAREVRSLEAELRQAPATMNLVLSDG
jgi:hypothetical protein